MRIDLAAQRGEVGFVRRVKTIAAVISVTFGVAASGAEEAPLVLVFDTPQAEFGERYQHQTVVHRFAVSNPSDQTVRILSLIPRSQDGWVEGVPVEVAPGGNAELIVHQPLAERLGKTSVRVGVYTDERASLDTTPGTAHYKLGLSGFVQSAYDPESLLVGLGWVDAASGAKIVVELASREVPQLSLLDVRELPPGITVRDAGAVGRPGEGRKIELEVAAGSPLGLHEGRVLLVTNVENQSLMALRYQANVFADVVPDRSPIKFSGSRALEAITETLELRSRSAQPVRIASVEDPEGHFELLADEPCSEGDSSCRRLTLQAWPEAGGSLGGTLKILLEGQIEPIPVVYRGWVLAAGTEIRRIDATDAIEEAAGNG